MIRLRLLTTFLAGITSALAYNLHDFGTCISTGSAETCTLDSSSTPYSVTSSAPLIIGRSGFRIQGGGAPGDTILQRGDSGVTYIMTAAVGVTGVTIKNLTFDGNRYGVGLGLNCVSPSYWDLQLDNHSDSPPVANGTFTVQYVDFKNGPSTALELNGQYSSVSYGNFGTSGSMSGSRWISVYLLGNQSSVMDTNLEYGGTGAVDVEGTNQSIYGNYFYKNRYELGGGSGAGGQLYLGPSSAAATVTANWIDGASWGGYNGTVNGCTSSTGAEGGIEVYSLNTPIDGYHRFYTNEIKNHTGTGLILAGKTVPTDNVTIAAGYNPIDPSDIFAATRAIHNNAYRGIWFRGSEDGYAGSSTGLTLDGIQVYDNTGYEVYLSTVTGTGFTSSTTHIYRGTPPSCTFGDIIGDTATHPTNVVPSSNTCP